MKARILLFLFLTVSVSNLFAANGQQNQASPPEPNIIEPNVAILAASDYLPYYYPGDWQYFDHYTIYDINGVPAAYTIVFRDVNCPITEPNQLEGKINEFRQQHQQIKEQYQQYIEQLPPADVNTDETAKNMRKQASKMIRSQYFTSVFATVMTSAVDTESVVLRCYPGLPDFFVKQQELQEQVDSNFPAQERKLNRLMYFNSIDIRFEVIEQSKVVKKLDKAEKFALPAKQRIEDETLTLAFKGDEKGFKKIAIEREKLQVIKQQKAQQMQQLKPEDQERFRQGELNRKQHNASNWAEYQTKYLNEQSQQKKDGGK